MPQSTPVAITGIGCLCAAGLTLEDCMKSIFAGNRSPAPPARFSSSHPAPYPVFEIARDFSELCSAKNPDILRTSRLALAAAHQALEDAGWRREDLIGKRVGVCIGTTVGSSMNNEEFYFDYRKGGHPDMSPIVRYLNSNPATNVEIEFDLSGPSQTIVNACSSGTDAIGVAASWIQGGICDVAIAGGEDELCLVTYNGVASLKIASDAPCRPFDRDRSGLNLGEGAALLAMESDKILRKRDKKPRAYVMGYGSACDAYHLTAPAPDGKGLKIAIQEALSLSGTNRSDIAFVNAHGTATLDNDLVESRSLKDMLPGIPFISTKGITGHTLGAAGAIEAAFTIACLEIHKIPASAGFSQPDPNLPASPERNEREFDADIAVSESLAFGGNNAVLIFGRGKA